MDELYLDRVKGRYVCSQPKVVGPCEARIPRWWFNKKANCCLRFYYGGCKGNGNNFKTKAACLRRCKTGLCESCIKCIKSNSRVIQIT